MVINNPKSVKIASSNFDGSTKFYPNALAFTGTAGGVFLAGGGGNSVIIQE